MKIHRHIVIQILGHIVWWAFIGYAMAVIDIYDSNVEVEMLADKMGQNFLMIRQYTHPYYALPRLLSGMLFFYVFSYFIFPKFIVSGKWLNFLSSFIILAILTYFVLTLIDAKIVEILNAKIVSNQSKEVSNQSKELGFIQVDSYLSEKPGINFTGIYLLITIISSIGYSFASFWIRDQKEKEKIKQEKVLIENQLLRAQVNPHFLFNTLNTFFSLAQQHEAPEIEEGVATLSDMFRYTLGSSQMDMMPLEKELEYLGSYVYLQSLRFKDGDDVDIVFDIEGDPGSYQIHQMILMNFIENAFKHGINSAHPSFVHIFIQITGDRLIMEVKNSSFASAHKRSNGIGQKNVLDRLELLYGGKYDLKLWNHENVHNVRLELELKRNLV